MQYYSVRDYVPKNIFVDMELEDADNITQFLKMRCGHAVSIACPKRGETLKLVELSRSNASEYLSINVGRTGREIVALDELAKALDLQKPPKLIECYDISNLGNTNVVAGMVVFENGRPNKKLYRKFAVKDVIGQDDYACMREVVKRRFEHYKNGDEAFAFKPDLILLDGGTGHVNTIAPLLKEMEIDIPLYGLVKDSKHRTRAIATGGSEISLSQRSAGFHLITEIQDEVHRFAITFQRSKRKAAYGLRLTEVRGIGEAKAKLILKNFKTKEALKAASVEQLMQAAKVNEDTARQLKEIIGEM